MARKALVDSIIKLYSKLGGNVGEVLGTRTNISFLGTGKSPEGFIDSTINIDAIGALGKNKVLEELKSSIGYLTANKLNDIQAGKLYENMLKIDDVFNPKQIPNIIDMGTGTRNLTQEGLGSLRAPKEGFSMEIAEGPQKGKKISLDEFFEMTGATRKTDDDIRAIKDELDLPPLRDVIDARNEKSLNLPPLMSRVESQMNKIKGTSSKLDDAMKEYENIYKPRGTNEIEALETMTKNRAGEEFITGFVDDVYRNSGVTASVDIAKKRAAAREFLFTMLKKETDLLPQGGTLESVINPTDYKYIIEGGGGALGDPLILVKKYFGDTIARRLPLNSDRVVIEEFVDNVRFTKDRAGFATDDPRFNPDDIPEFKHGGLAKILEV
jgi:hypothetical protein